MPDDWALKGAGITELVAPVGATGILSFGVILGVKTPRGEKDVKLKNQTGDGTQTKASGTT